MSTENEIIKRVRKKWRGTRMKDTYKWGDPEKYNEGLGDYKKILNEYLLPNIQDKIVIDLGCGPGKWTKYMEEAKLVYAIDIVLEFRRDLKAENIQFVHSEDGKTFPTIPDNSVDYVFCIDSLVRSSKDIIESYAKEIQRVLKEDGMMCIHLPCTTKKLSREKGFTKLNTYQIEQMFPECYIDTKTLEHGVLVCMNIPNTI